MKDLKDDFLHIVNFITSVEKLIEKEDTVSFTIKDVELLEKANEKLDRIVYELYCRLEVETQRD